MADLSTTYMGLALKNPVVPSASPLSRDLDNIRKMEDAGAGAITLYSLFEEQIDREALLLDDILEDQRDRYTEMTDFFPEPDIFRRDEIEYLELIRKAKTAVDIPVIASLNDYSEGGWTGYAKAFEEAGADGLVLFNRFYQPDLDIEGLSTRRNLVLSTSEEMRLPLRWIGILYGKIPSSLALTSGIHTPEDVVKAIMAGADIANVCSVLLENGIDYIKALTKGIDSWMVRHNYDSLDQIKGLLSHKNTPNPSAFERANYVHLIGAEGIQPYGHQERFG